MIPLSWTSLTLRGINKNGTARYSGRVNAVVMVKGTVVIGTENGGVWAIDPTIGILDGFATQALSDAWDDPDVSSLANGPDGAHQVYVGCSRTLTYFELATGSGGPSLSRLANIPFPVAQPGIFHCLLVDAHARRLIVATGAGVWWSAIPTNPANTGGYAWQQATGLPGVKVAGLCFATQGAVHAAIWGDGISGSSNNGIFKGTFTPAGLSFRRSNMHWLDGVADDQITRVSLASCASNPDVAFAVCSDPTAPHVGAFRGVLKYDPPSDAWRDTRDTIPFALPSTIATPGRQGNFNNCIAVAPDDASLVAFGWQAGTFVLQNGAWTLLTSPEAHHDIHALLFERIGSGGHRLYVGGDGGILQVNHPAHASPAFDDRLNVFLPDLLFKKGFGGPYATTDVSHTVDGLISGGLQDNGVKYLKTTDGAYRDWQQIEGADGGTNEFLTNGVLICRESNKGNRFRGVRWIDSTSQFGPSFALPVDVTILDDPRMCLCSRIITPTFRNKDGELLHAVSAAVKGDSAGAVPKNTNIVLGLFGDDALGKPHWAVIGTMPALVGAVGSMTGDVVVVGLADGTVQALNVGAFLNGAPAFASPLPLPATLPSGSIAQFEVVSAALIFALYAGQTGHLLVFDGRSWQEIPLPVSETVYSFAIDWTARTIYIVTDTSVYQGVQNDAGSGIMRVGFNTSFSWMESSSGLPARSHGTHLRLGADAGGRYLYLSTFGRSVYRAAVTTTPAQPGSGEKAGVKVLFGVIQDGGGVGIDLGTGKLIIIPPRQPVEAVLGDLLASESLRGASGKDVQAQRRAALERIGQFVTHELEADGRAG